MVESPEAVSIASAEPQVVPGTDFGACELEELAQVLAPAAGDTLAVSDVLSAALASTEELAPPAKHLANVACEVLGIPKPKIPKPRTSRLDTQKMSGKPGKPIDELCISMAKAAFSHNTSPRSRANNPALGNDKKATEKCLQVQILSNIIVNFADNGRISQAEEYMIKLDARQGMAPDIQAVNSMIRAYIAAGQHDTAEEWLAKALHPQLYPEMGDLRPNNGTFHYMISCLAGRGLIGQCENYMREMDVLEMRPTLAIYEAVIRGCINSGPQHARRAHRWCEELCSKGCSDFDGDSLSASLVKQERQIQAKDPFARFKFKLGDFDILVMDLAMVLVDSRSGSRSAIGWLEFLVESGLNPRADTHAQLTWEHVRAAHPKDIIPTLLSAEACAQGSSSLRKGAPSLAVPARLPGENFVGGRPAPAPPVQAVSSKRPSPRPSLRTAASADANKAPGNARMCALREAISAAEEVCLGEAELRKYRTALELEERKAISRLQLQEALRQARALDAGSQGLSAASALLLASCAPDANSQVLIADLAAALTLAEAAGLEEVELGEAKEVLLREEGKLRARQRLEEAMGKREAVELPKLQPQANTGHDALEGRDWRAGAITKSPRHYVSPRSRTGKAADLAAVDRVKQTARILYV